MRKDQFILDDDRRARERARLSKEIAMMRERGVICTRIPEEVVEQLFVDFAELERWLRPSAWVLEEDVAGMVVIGIGLR